jgi:predicted RNase H-like HicB family nuclease
MHRYGINIHWDDIDKVYIAEVPELPGCSAHGNTYEKALNSVQEAIQLWIDTAIEIGRKIPKQRESTLRKNNRKISVKETADHKVAATVTRGYRDSRSVIHRTGHRVKDKNK